jgi:hypothetical protein
MNDSECAFGCRFLSRCPDEDEAALTLRALVDVNECKFLAPDVPLFHAICADLFPGVVAHPPAHVALRGAILRQCAASGLQPTPYFLCKARPAAPLTSLARRMWLSRR